MLRIKFSISLAIAALSVGLGPSALAATLFITFYDDDQFSWVLAEIDPANGDVTVVGPMMMTFLPQGLAFDSKNNVLYATEVLVNDNLYRVDPGNGSTTVVGPIGFDSVTGLTYDASSDVLYGIQSGFGEDMGALLIIDRTTGAGTLVGVGANGASSREYVPATDQLLFYLTVGGLSLLGEIDRSTGSQTIIGHTLAGGMGGMGYDPDSDILYALAGSSNNVLYEINSQTGRATALVTLSRTEDYSSMAVGPTPIPTVSTWGMAALVLLVIVAGTVVFRRVKLAT